MPATLPPHLAPPSALNPPLTTATRLKSIIGGSAGNLVEWFDWYAYAAFTLYFAPVIFPEGNRTAQLLSAAMIFAVGFLMRPIGAWLMGIYADRHGRKAGLTLSVTLMCAGSLMIAVTPVYERAGLLAPVMLVIARMIQGISVGGEYGASAVYLSEMAGRNHRGFFSSFQYVTLIGGQLTALALLVMLQALLSEHQLEQWGWRIPFVLGALLALLVFVIRRRMAETSAFSNHAVGSTEKSGAFALFRRHPVQAFMVIFMTAGGTLAFYAYSIYMQKFLVNTSGLTREQASSIMALALFIFMLMQPLAGALSDRIGRKPLLIAFSVAGVVFTVPLFRALERANDPVTAFWLVLGGLVIVTGYTSINAVVKAELFPAHIRALGVALPYAIANTVFGGTAEYAALALKGWGVESWFYWYVTAMIGLSLIVNLRLPETKVESLIED